ncbi:MAG: MerR family transcriptional regulator [Lachnospiraceae bacterium]|nr:MerR family transcriptional regulator [Lachnospiraceae bacterium]
MKEKRYFISDAAKELEVESHVLRYWEEELNLEIPRNEMGHRYYREDELEMLKCIKELKARGFQLKTIGQILNELQEGKGQAVDTLRAIQAEEIKEEHYENMRGEDPDFPMEQEPMDNVIPIRRDTYKDGSMVQSQGRKLQEFEEIMKRIVGHAMKENSHVFGEEVSEQVSERVLKEMDYLMRLQEEREEKHFQNLDNTIRQYQKGKKEAAAARVVVKAPKKKRKSRFFQKRRKRMI